MGSEEFKQLCRDFVTIETEHAEFMELKTNLEEAAEALGIENASLKEIRDAIQEKCEELQTENSNLKGLVEAAGDIAEENEILETEVASMRDVCDGLEARKMVKKIEISQHAKYT